MTPTFYYRKSSCKGGCKFMTSTTQLKRNEKPLLYSCDRVKKRMKNNTPLPAFTWNKIKKRRHRDIEIRFPLSDLSVLLDRYVYFTRGKINYRTLFSMFLHPNRKKSVLNGVRQGIALKEPLSVHKRRELFYYVTRSLWNRWTFS